MQTGFKSIDNLIGGFQPGELITLSARPSDAQIRSGVRASGGE